MLLKCCTQYVSKFGKPNSSHRTGKGQSISRFPRREVLKNVQTTGHLDSLSMLVKLCSKSFRLGFNLVAQTVKSLPAVGETQVKSLGWEDPLLRRKWQPIPVLLPGKAHGWRHLEGYTVYGVAKSRTQLSNFISFQASTVCKQRTSRYTNWI